MVKVFAGNLPRTVEPQDLDEIFKKYGDIRSITMKDGFAFVEFEDDRDAEDAVHRLDGVQLHNRPIRVEISHGGRRRGPDARDSCFVCGERGHWAQDCRRGDGSSVASGRCFRCGSASHLARDCRERPRRHSPSPRRGGRSPSPRRRYSPSPRRRYSPSPRRRYSPSPRRGGGASPPRRRYSPSPRGRSPRGRSPPPRGRSPSPR